MMPGREPAGLAPDFPCAAASALQDAAALCGLDARDARLIRLFATAVYHLPCEDAVARIALLTSPNSVTRLATSVRVVQWLTETAFQIGRAHV